MLLKRSYLASDMTSKNVFKIKSKCCTKHVSRQLLSVVRAGYCFKHISVPANLFRYQVPVIPVSLQYIPLPYPLPEGYIRSLVCYVARIIIIRIFKQDKIIFPKIIILLTQKADFPTRYFPRSSSAHPLSPHTAFPICFAFACNTFIILQGREEYQDSEYMLLTLQQQQSIIAVERFLRASDLASL